jgi:hypothetical protein
MKLSRVKKDDITREILDIFDKPQKKLESAKDNIAKENYFLWYAQYEAIAKQLPIELLAKDRNASTKVMDNGYEASWSYYFENPMPMLLRGSGYSSHAIALELDASLTERAQVIVEEGTALNSEKVQLRAFVDESMSAVNTTTQLRKLWELYPALVKHIPPEPIRKKEHTQSVLDLESTLDLNAINKRLTENLLEG